MSSISVEPSTSSKHAYVQPQSSETFKSKLIEKPTSSKNLSAKKSPKSTDCSPTTNSSKPTNSLSDKINLKKNTDENEDKDQIITIIMKQPKSCTGEPFLENKLIDTKLKLSSSSHHNFHHSAMLLKNDKNSIFIKDMIKKVSCINNTNNENEDENEYENQNEDDDDEDDDDEDDDEDEDENDEEYYDDEECNEVDEECNEDDEKEKNCSNLMPASPLVEEFLKSMNEKEENVIFVQSLSSLAKKTLFNQQCQHQRKLLNRTQQQVPKDTLNESNKIIHLSSFSSNSKEQIVKAKPRTFSQHQINTLISK